MLVPVVPVAVSDMTELIVPVGPTVCDIVELIVGPVDVAPPTLLPDVPASTTTFPPHAEARATPERVTTSSAIAPRDSRKLRFIAPDHTPAYVAGRNPFTLGLAPSSTSCPQA